ncbi:MAG: sodium:solute symporter [bacterium]|nr:sodium:solute symporter [bacterium]
MEYILSLVIYLVVMIGVTLYSKKKIKTVDDYALGGRQIPSWMSAFSYGTAYFSAVILVGHAGKNGWTYGMAAFWVVIGNSFLGTYLAWKVLGKRTREMTRRLNSATMPQFLGTRYKDSKLRYITAFIIFIFLVPYAASVYKGLGALFEITFHINENYIMLFMTVVTAVYLLAGGFLAASIADFIQGCIMIVGVGLLIIYILKDPNVGGVVNGVQSLKAINPDLIKPFTKDTFVPLLSLVIMTSLGTWGLPQMVSRFYTIKNEKSIPVAKVVSTIFAIIITTGAYTMGGFSRLLISSNGGKPAILVNGVLTTITFDQIVPNILNNTLPKILLALLLVVILAASMSTLSSIVLASSTTFVMDLIKPIRKEKITEKQTMILLRVCCLLFIIAAYLLAIGDSPILNLNALSWGVVAGVLLAPYLIGLYWKKATRKGVYASIFSAIAIMGFGLLKYGINSAMITTVSAGAIVLPNLVLVAVSLVTSKLEQTHLSYIFNSCETKINEIK